MRKITTLLKKLLFYIGIAVLLASVVSGCSKSEDNIKKANIVVVIDKSMSMSETDENRVAEFAVNMLISACDDYRIPFYENLNTNINMGVVTFGIEAEEVVPLTSLYKKDKSEYDDIKEKIGGIEYDDKSGTNYYSGLDMAMDMCENDVADENIIFLMSDGQLDLNGLKNYDGDLISKKDEDAEKERIRDDFLNRYQNRLSGDINYSIFTVGIDTRKDKIGINGFDDLAELVDLCRSVNGGNGKDYYIDADSTEIMDLFVDFIENVYHLLNPNADDIEIESIDMNYDDITCEFELDKNYKTVQILLAAVDNTTDGEKIKVEKIQAPKVKEFVVSSENFSIKNSKITINENSGTAIGVYIDNASKGKWVIHLNRKAKIVAKIFMFNPFPYYVIPIVIAAVLFIVIILMYILKIPPIAYRRKLVSGYLSVSSINTDGLNDSETPLCTNFPLMKGNKYLNKGYITLGSATGIKKYKKYTLKYNLPVDDLDEGSVDLANRKERTTLCVLENGRENIIELSDFERLKIIWKS